MSYVNNAQKVKSVTKWPWIMQCTH